MSNIVRARVGITGTRTLIQNHFGMDAIPLEKGEQEGVAGNVPNEWKKTCMVDETGQLYLPGTYIFSCLKNGAVHTKKGRGSMQPAIVSTLQVEEDVILLDRKIPPEKELKMQYILSPTNPEIETFIYVTGVRNPKTKARNIRYRLATRAGWKCQFTLVWDKTVVAREVMRAVLNDSGKLGGLGDGIRIGCGRFDVTSYKELVDADDKHEENGAKEKRPVLAGR